MRYVLLTLLLLNGCTSAVHTIRERCRQATYDANTTPCDGLRSSSCTYIDAEVDCEVLRF